MKQAALSAMSLFVMLFVIGCGESAPAGDAGVDAGPSPVASCHFTTTFICIQYGGLEGGALVPYRNSCGTSGGTWAEADCPRENAYGGCQETNVLGTLTNFFYAGGGYPSAAAAQEACEMDDEAVWVAP